MKKLSWLMGFVGFLISLSLQAEMQITHIPPEAENDIRSQYYLDLLKLVLKRTENGFGPARLREAQVRIKQSRAVQLVRDNAGLDIMWTMTSKEREEQLLPIRIPIQKGLLGHRIFIIQKGAQKQFDEIVRLEQLAELEAGQGHDWPDTKILRANGLNVRTNGDYNGLFRMLEGGRFDYYPRGVAEPFLEVKNRSDMAIEIEKKLLLKYPAPIFFFVNKNNLELANRIETGLRLMIDDGSFDEFFISHPAIKPILEQANIKGRLIFELENPLLTDETQQILADPSLWYR